MTKTQVSLVIDRSGSMNGIERSMFSAAGSMLKKLRDKAKEGHDVKVSVITFANNVTVNLFPTDVRNLNDTMIEQLWKDISIGGGTALFDATIKGIELLNSLDDEASGLLMCYTDGGENQSSTSAATIQKKFNELEKTDKYTLTFQVPRHGKSELTRFGISADNIREWDQTESGVKEVEKVSTQAIDTYFTARSAGTRSVKNFYVGVDASKITDKDLNKLEDVSDHFKLYKVDKESDIKTFVESKTKKEYVFGSAFYELTKSEKIQKNKQLLIIKKGDSIIYGGRGIRNLLNIPENADAKVDVVNLSNYRIFVKSTSSNRKLVRGAGVLIDPKKKRGDVPTWEDLTKA